MRNALSVMLLVFAAGVVARRNVLRTELRGVHDHGVEPVSFTRGSIIEGLPPSAAAAAEQLAKSPRHREYVAFPTPGVPGDSIRAWVFYPQVSHKAPVIVVIHEIFGMTTWVKGVGDQLAADGFVAIVPDLIHRAVTAQGPDTMPRDDAVRAIRTLQAADVQRDIDAAASYASHLPAALPVYATVGFCWGGSTSFAHAVHTPTTSGGPSLKVVYYGATPDSSQLAQARAPVLGLYGGEDARISSTVPGTDSAMQRLHKTYVDRIYAGAGHGFLRAQNDSHDAPGAANADAARDAWPRTLAWFHQYLGG